VGLFVLTMVLVDTTRKKNGTFIPQGLPPTFTHERVQRGGREFERWGTGTVWIETEIFVTVVVYKSFIRRERDNKRKGSSSEGLLVPKVRRTPPREKKV